MALDIKIDSAQFIDTQAKIIAQANIVLANSDLKKEIGDFAVARIQYQARVGAPMNMNQNFPALKPSTIQNRRYLGRYNSVHPTFDPAFSNLTITGSFLDSLTWTDEGDTLLALSFKGDHRPYGGKHNQIITKPLTNAVLSGYLAAKGFKPFDVSLQYNTTFVNRIKTICLRYIRRGLKISNQVADADSDE